MSTPEDFPFVTTITSDIRRGGTTALSQKTLITGNNGEGKSSVTLALTLAVSGTAFNIQGRRRVKEGKRLRRLGSGHLTATATFGDGQAATFELGDGEATVSAPSYVVPERLFPLVAIEDALAKDDKGARALFLGWIGPGVTEADILAKMNEGAHAKFREVAAAQVGSWVERVELVATYAKKRAADLEKEVTAKETELAALPLPPEEARVAYVKQQQQLGNTLLAQAIAYEAVARFALEPAVRVDLEKTLETAQQAIAHYTAEKARGQVFLDANPVPVKVPEPKGPAEQAVALLWDPQAPAGKCPLCFREAEAAFLTGCAEYWVVQERDRKEASKAPTDPLVEARAQAQHHVAECARLLALWSAEAQRAQSQLAADKPLPQKPPMSSQAIRDTLTTLSTEWDQLQRLLGQTAKAPELRAAIAALKRDVPTYQLLHAECLRATGTLLNDLSKSFEDAVQRYLPEGWVFGAAFSEDSFQIGLRVAGKLLDPSEAQRTAVTVAMAMAVAELGGAVKKGRGRPSSTKKEAPYLLVIPEDRDWDVDTLGQVMRAWSKFPGQVVIEATEKPRGKFPAGWTHVDVSAGKEEKAKGGKGEDVRDQGGERSQGGIGGHATLGGSAPVGSTGDPGNLGNLDREAHVLGAAAAQELAAAPGTTGIGGATVEGAVKTAKSWCASWGVANRVHDSVEVEAEAEVSAVLQVFAGAPPGTWTVPLTSEVTISSTSEDPFWSAQKDTAPEPVPKPEPKCICISPLFRDPACPLPLGHTVPEGEEHAITVLGALLAAQ